MQRKPLDKITVKELVEACEVNRQTFYYHFRDIYDLLGWIYRTEALESIRNNKSYDTWQQGVLTILEYVQDNRNMCVNTYRSVAREHLEALLHEVLYSLLGDVVDEVAGTRVLSPDSRSFITKFYSYAFAGVLLDWISSGMKTPTETVVENVARMMDGNVSSAVRRFQEAEQ
jgi:probable dihydroxyacetone kinase regulator